MKIEMITILLFTVAVILPLFTLMMNSKRSALMVSNCMIRIFTWVIVLGSYLSTIIPATRARWGIIATTCFVKLFYDVMFLLHERSFLKPICKNLLIAGTFSYIINASVIIFTNPLHHLFIREITAEGNTFGILYYTLMTAGCALEIIGALCVWQYWGKKLDNQPYRLRATVLAVCYMFFLHLYLMRIHSQFLCLYILVIIFSFLYYFYGANKYGIWGANSLKSIYGLEMLTDALLLTDRMGNTVYQNKACELLSEETLRVIRERFQREQERSSDNQREARHKVTVSQDDCARYYSFTVRKVRGRLLPTTKYLYIIQDETKTVTAIQLLSEKNQYLQEMHDSVKSMANDLRRLAVLQERDQLAREIHDVIGHSLILALNTMESNRLLDDNRAQAMRRIKQAVSEIKGSLEEVSEQSDNKCGGILSARLSVLADRLSDSGIVLETELYDDARDFGEVINNTLYRICQEAVTNAIKHGRAEKITISIKRKHERITLHIIDNGQGCCSYTKGTGLTSMEERVHKLNGTISFHVFEDHLGFMVRADIPVHTECAR